MEFDREASFEQLLRGVGRFDGVTPVKRCKASGIGVDELGGCEFRMILCLTLGLGGLFLVTGGGDVGCRRLWLAPVWRRTDCWWLWLEGSGVCHTEVMVFFWLVFLRWF